MASVSPSVKHRGTLSQALFLGDGDPMRAGLGVEGEGLFLLALPDPHKPLLAQGDPVLCLPTLPILVYMLGSNPQYAFKGFCPHHF